LTERELSRGAARRLAIIQHVEEVTGNVAMTCRYFGISRHTYYFWLRRYEQLGPEGLRERSHRPLVCPHATKAEVVGKIIHLRQHYHFGPEKISMYLKRYHEVSVSPSGIWRILKRANLNRLPASQRYKRHTERWKRYEKQQPGHAVQIDVKVHRADQGRPQEALPVHRHRRLHSTAGPADLRAPGPEDRDQVR
jgi:transposase-like protein